jgi:hypothetical protein
MKRLNRGCQFLIRWNWVAEHVHLHGAADAEFAELLGAGAAALHDDAEYDCTKYSSGDANDGGGFHCNSSFLGY